MPKYNTSNVHRGGTPILTEKYVEKYMLDHIVEQLNEEILKAEQRAARMKSKAKISQASLQAELDRLNTMYQKGRISEEYYDIQYNELASQLNSLQSNIITVESFALIQKVFSGNWQAVYTDLDAAHRNAFWKSVIKDIYLDMNTRKISGFRFLI